MDALGSASIITGDCIEVMQRWPAGMFQLVVADPPFGINYDYGGEYDDESDRYSAFTSRWIEEAVRVLSRTGSIFVMIGDEKAAEVKIAMDGFGLTMRNWIIWHYTFGPHQTKKFGRDHCHILYYVRDPKRFVFNSDAIRVKSRRQEIGDKRANPKGRVPSDVWQFPRIPGNSKSRTGHPCQQPIEILKRIILATTNKGDCVLDPFSGSGTGPLAAMLCGRNGIGIEQSAKFADLSRVRIRKAMP